MKKLLVLISIVSLLAFAGSAFGATTWTDPTTDDEVGHYVDTFTDMTQSDIVGHYGQDAYDWWVAYQKAQANASAAVSAVTNADNQAAAKNLISTLGLSNAVVATSATAPSAAALSAMAALVTNSQTMNIPFTIPAIGIPSGAVAGTTVVVACLGTVTSSNISAFNSCKLDLYGMNSSNKTAKAAAGKTQMYLVHGTTAVDNQATMTGFTSGERVFLLFVVGDTSTYNTGVNGISASAVPTSVQTAMVTTTASGTPTALFGSSGGGCALGTSALALAVLGLFIAKRRG